MRDTPIRIPDNASPAATGMDGHLTAMPRQLSRNELLAIHDAAAVAIECIGALAKKGRNPVTEVLAGANTVEEWARFPTGGVIDRGTHCQFYYHAHATHERAANEHGHFHTFVRAKRPAREPPSIVAASDAAWISHLVGISTDASGQVNRLFTTNRWVTDEVWHAADALIGMLDQFDMTVSRPSRDLNRWITAIIRMFRPQIVELIRARDLRVTRWRAIHPDEDVLEDRDLQVTSEIAVDFLTKIRAIDAAMDRA